jgi:hypothetical protein
MAKFPWQYVNINGIPTIKTQTVVVSDTAVTYKFAPDFDGRPFRGLILVYISEAIPTGTTTTLPVQFSMAGTTSNVTVAGGAAITVADLPGVGIYLVYFDRWADTLQLIGNMPATATTQNASSTTTEATEEPNNSMRTVKKSN